MHNPRQSKVPISRAELARRIRYLKDEGCTIPEIATQVGIRRTRAWRIARQHGIALGNDRFKRRVTCALTPTDVEALNEIAVGAGISRSEMLSRIASVMLEDRAKLRRLLGKLATPRRRYQGGAPS